MRLRQVLCPSCGTILEVPPGKADCFVRCGKCHTRFRLPKRIAVTDDAVTDWLSEEHDEEAKEHAVAAALRPHEEAASGTGTFVLPAVHEPIRLVKSDASGVLLEFAASRLTDPAFRCCMPRKCLRCGGQSNLGAHAIIYSTTLVDESSLEAEHSDGALSLKGPGIADLSDEELLNRMPKVPNVPPPANLPMPYWLCDMCTSRDILSGQIRMTTQGLGLCRLWIGNLRRAEEFLVAAGGKDTAAYTEIHRRIHAMAENPWSSLPPVVQNRLQQWFRPQNGEHFIAYVADRDRARSEQGLAGIVVTSKRLICHTLSRHKETAATDKVEFDEVLAYGKQCLLIRCPAWEFKYMTVDREGLAILRHALTKAKIPAAWH
ncbi:MAG: hypothetical protein WC869_02770 [Phycisphaerae bacterium]|jgi:LSD1 subclass zinc finger protein